MQISNKNFTVVTYNNCILLMCIFYTFGETGYERFLNYKYSNHSMVYFIHRNYFYLSVYKGIFQRKEDYHTMYVGSGNRTFGGCHHSCSRWCNRKFTFLFVAIKICIPWIIIAPCITYMWIWLTVQEKSHKGFNGSYSFADDCRCNSGFQC